jgi:hypothetical protein
VVVNDTRRAVRGHIEVTRVGDVAKLVDTAFEVQSNGKANVGTLPHPVKTEMWRLKWIPEGMSTCTSHYLATSTTVSFAQYKKWLQVPDLLPFS